MFPLEAQAFLRTAYGILFMTQLLMIWPFSRVYFVTEKYGGCIESNLFNDRVFTPLTHRLLLPTWFFTSAMITIGFQTVIFCSLQLLLCYIFFVRMRWASITRGMGAPGLMPTWLAHLVFWLEISYYFGDSDGHLRNWVVLAFRFDFAIMMIDSGINKYFHGYPQNMGMNYGLANPAWGYWPHFFQKFKKDFPLFPFLNHCAYALQIIGGVLMLVPGLEWIGAFVIGAGFFIGIKPLIRLGVLCDMLTLITFLYVKESGWFHHLLINVGISMDSSSIGQYAFPPQVTSAAILFFIAYVIFIPLAKIGMYINFYGNRRLPGFLQTVLEFFTNSFGIILWRVFTIDTVDFYVYTLFEDQATKKRTIVNRFEPWAWKRNNRFLWVGESVMMDVIFNSERYFPSTDLLQKRVLRYARTMAPPESTSVIFEYYCVVADENGYHGVLAKEFRVNPKLGIVEQVIVNDKIQAPQCHNCSPVRASNKPGSYAPVTKK